MADTTKSSFGTRVPRGRRRHGLSFVYGIVILGALLALASLAVDLGRVQLAKTELQQATDAAARYGALGLKNILSGQSAASANAVAAAAQNRVDGSPLVLTAADVQLVIWNSATKSYTVTTDPALANAVRVSASRTAAKGNAVPLTFMSVLGFGSCNITASAIAFYSAGASETVSVAATGNPFLAGMPAGSVASVGNPHNSPDYAPSQSPKALSLPVTAGRSMTFDGVNGGANNLQSTTYYSADGNTNTLVTNSAGSENGIANTKAPINCLVGVFLTASQPNLSAAPSSLDFSTTASRDFTTLSPLAKQIFFIGDGRTSSGEVQQFVVPAGATRLVIGTWDAYEWNNNIGSFSLTVHNHGSVSLVR